MSIASVHDVAEYILQQKGEMSAMKLQKLVYYSQAWSTVWDERPLFPENIQAWRLGPVVPELYEEHRGRFLVDTIPGIPENLDDRARETIDAVLNYYGDKNPQWLSDLTHMEDPWKDARGNLASHENGSEVITLDAMAKYYGSLPPDEE